MTARQTGTEKWRVRVTAQEIHPEASYKQTDQIDPPSPLPLQGVRARHQIVSIFHRPGLKSENGNIKLWQSLFSLSFATALAL